jgi:trigger factor
VPNSVEQLSPTRVKLTVEIPFADLKPHLDRAYREIANQVQIPGFRKGKVPAMVIDQRFGRGLVLQEAINSVLPQAYGKALQEAKIVPLGEPDIDVTKLEDGEVVEFAAEVDIRPEFAIPDVSKIKVEVPALPDVDKEVDERVELLRERFATSVEVERAAKKGDLVTLDLVAAIDGEQIPNGTSEGVTYTIGSGGMLEGLDEAVTGLKAGGSKTFKSTLVGGEAEGQEADIEVTVTKVAKRELPKVDDDFAQLVSEFDTVAEMREDLAKSVERYAKVEQVSRARNQALEELVKLTEFEVPEGVLAAEVEARRQQITDQLARAGLTLEAYLARVDDEGRTPEEFWAKMDEQTVQGLKAQLILDKIAEDEDLPVEQDDLTQMLVRKAMENGSTPEEEAKHMVEHNHIAGWTQEIRRNKALDWLTGKVKIVDSNGEKVDSVPEVPEI